MAAGCSTAIRKPVTGTMLFLLAGSATGDVVGPDRGGEVDRTPLGQNNIRSIFPGETASMSLVASNQATGELGFLNSGGEVSVELDAGPTSIGTRPDGVELFAEWSDDEGDGDFVRKTRAIWFSADGSALLPFGTMVGGQQAEFLKWHFGVGDILEWAPWVTEITILDARFFGSFDGGSTFAATDSIIGLFQSGLSKWDKDGAYDVGLELISDSSGSRGFNYVMTEYTYGVVPTPMTPVLLCGAGLLATHRRRRN